MYHSMLIRFLDCDELEPENNHDIDQNDCHPRTQTYSLSKVQTVVVVSNSIVHELVPHSLPPAASALPSSGPLHLLWQSQVEMYCQRQQGRCWSWQLVK